MEEWARVTPIPDSSPGEAWGWARSVEPVAVAGEQARAFEGLTTRTALGGKVKGMDAVDSPAITRSSRWTVVMPQSW